jgi:hypothetical protein
MEKWFPLGGGWSETEGGCLYCVLNSDALPRGCNDRRADRFELGQGGVEGHAGLLNNILRSTPVKCAFVAQDLDPDLLAAFEGEVQSARPCRRPRLFRGPSLPTLEIAGDGCIITRNHGEE